MLLKDKKILVAVTGSIAIYKTLELIRLYIKAGAKVRVIMTKSAKKFVSAITFEAISQSKVLDEDSENWDKNQDYNHIDIGKWADIFIIAPASANTINKLANGIADNLLLQTALAYPKQIILVPAANTNMLRNQITQESIEKLQGLNYEVVSSQVKELACKDVGDGAMAEPSDIFDKTLRELFKNSYWENRKVVLSGGGTIEKIDEVRYISNFSSGKMATALSKALYYLGADVCLVATRGYEELPKQVQVIKVQSSKEMFKSLSEAISKSKNDANKMEKRAYLFMVAAISDYLPFVEEKGKLKKEQLGDTWSLELKQNIDILKSLDRKNLISVGFKAELDENTALSSAKNMLKNKDLDAVCLNVLSDSNNFGSDNNDIELILKNDSSSFKGTKLAISLEILEHLQEEFKDYV